jgi:hypothetical protein
MSGPWYEEECPTYSEIKKELKEIFEKEDIYDEDMLKKLLEEQAEEGFGSWRGYYSFVRKVLINDYRNMNTEHKNTDIVNEPISELNIVNEPISELNIVNEPVSELNIVNEPVSELNIVKEPISDKELKN